MKIEFKDDKIIINKILFRKTIKALDISKISFDGEKIFITYGLDGKIEKCNYIFNLYDREIPMYEFVLNNNIEYEDLMNSTLEQCTSRECDKLIEEFIKDFKEYVDKIVTERISKNYELKINRFDDRHRSYLEYDIIANGKIVQGDWDMTLLVKYDSNYGIKHYVLTSEVTDRNEMKEYLDEEIKELQ